MKNSKFKFLIIFFALLLIFALPVYSANTDKKQPFQVSQNPQIQQIKPKKPVQIKLHRNAKGEYSWDIRGDNVDEVIKADSRLRKLLKVE
jgi:hypothetical protein